MLRLVSTWGQALPQFLKVGREFYSEQNLLVLSNNLPLVVVTSLLPHADKLMAGVGAYLRATLTQKSSNAPLAQDSRAIIPLYTFATDWDIFMRILAKDTIWCRSAGHTSRNVKLKLSTISL